MLQPTHPVLASIYTDIAKVEFLTRVFAQNGYVKLPGFIDELARARISEELARIEGEKGSKNFLMPGYNTPRFMHTLGGKKIREQSPLLTAIYSDETLIRTLAAISKKPVYPCGHPNEFMVINFLQDAGGTHGWHLDDPQLALIIVLEAPGEEAGGLLEFIPSWKEFCAGIGARPDQNVEQHVEIARQAGMINARYHAAGEAYLLNASEALHRVTALRSSTQRRVAINMGYETENIVEYGETANLLYG